MLSDQFVAELHAAGAPQPDVDEYKRATGSLLRAYGRFHMAASSRAATRIRVGVPIGALTSRVIANLSLAPLDGHVASRPGVLCYRRYVDDLVIVAKADAEHGRGAPVISVDTKKKELVGDFTKAGREWQPAGEPVPVRVHDFIDKDLGKAIPYGVYDLASNATGVRPSGVKPTNVRLGGCVDPRGRSNAPISANA